MRCIQDAVANIITNTIDLRLGRLAESRAFARKQESLRALAAAVFRILEKRSPPDLVDGLANIAHDSLETKQLIANIAMLLMSKT